MRARWGLALAASLIATGLVVSTTPASGASAVDSPCSAGWGDPAPPPSPSPSSSPPQPGPTGPATPPAPTVTVTGVITGGSGGPWAVGPRGGQAVGTDLTGGFTLELPPSSSVDLGIDNELFTTVTVGTDPLDLGSITVPSRASAVTVSAIGATGRLEGVRIGYVGAATLDLGTPTLSFTYEPPVAFVTTDASGSATAPGLYAAPGVLAAAIACIDGSVALATGIPGQDLTVYAAGLNGIAPEVESGAPNNGDGNADGLPDSTQANVASLPTAVAPGTDYLTVASPVGTLLTGVTAIDPATLPTSPAGISLPSGLVGFVLSGPGVAPGSDQTIDLVLPSVAGVTGWAKYDASSTAWSTLPADRVEILSSPDRIRIRLTDGGIGDADGVVNGSISDPGGAYLSTRSVPTVSVSPVSDLVPDDATVPLSVSVTGAIPGETLTLQQCLNRLGDVYACTTIGTVPVDAAGQAAGTAPVRFDLYGAAAPYDCESTSDQYCGVRLLDWTGGPVWGQQAISFACHTGEVCLPAPVILTQPGSTTARVGEQVFFSSYATSGVGGPDTPIRWEQSVDGGLTWTDAPGGFSYGYSFYVTDLSQDGTKYRARFTSSPLSTVYSDAATLTVVSVTAPSEPTNVSGAPRIGGVRVTWGAPATDGGSPVTSYVVRCIQTGAQAQVSATTTARTFTGLTAGTPYTFSVVAHNAIGDSLPSLTTPVVPALGPPGAPTDVIAVRGASRTVQLSWTAPTDTGGSTITGYVVTAQPGGLKRTLTTPVTSYAFTGLTNGTSYTFTVQAKSAAAQTSVASAPSNAVVPLGPSAAPSAVTSTPYNASVRVAWTPPTATGGSPVTGYVVTVVRVGGATTTLSVTGPADHVVVTGLTNGASYRVRIAAVTDYGAGTASALTTAVKPLASLGTAPA